MRSMQRSYSRAHHCATRRSNHRRAFAAAGRGSVALIVAFSGVLAGGGLRLGRAIGETDDLGKKSTGAVVTVPDFHATIHAALGIDPSKNLYAGSRPVPITDRGKPVAEVFS